MAEERPLAGLTSALLDLGAWLDAAGLRAAVIGGVAASLVGRPRLTRDVDCLVVGGDAEHLLRTAQEFGFRPRIPDATSFALESQVVLLRHETSGVDVDVTLGALPFEEEVVARATRVGVAGVTLPVATAEDLVVMKAVAGRPRDLADIEGILDARPDLDVARVRALVRAFAETLEAPRILTALETLLREYGAG